MEWLTSLFTPGSPAQGSAAQSMWLLGLVIATGLALGSVKVFGISLGVAGVLFAGIAAGHFGLRLSPEVLEFAREFGLILFVYTIGIQVGPGFFASLRRQGLKLNALAASVVLLGVLTALIIHFVAGVDLPAALGLLTGATTNTPSLAAAQQAMRDKAISDALYPLAGLGYALAYPFGVLGVILAMLLLRRLFRVDVAEEGKVFLQAQGTQKPTLGAMNLEVRNPNCDGLSLKRLPIPADSGVVISRVLHQGVMRVATPETSLAVGDTVLAVGPREQLDAARIVLGTESEVDLEDLPGPITAQKVIVTNKQALGKQISALDFGRRHGAAITRVIRADIELPVGPEVELQFGDRLVVVGEPHSIEAARAELGDSANALNHPMLVPVFVGIALGVVLGTMPIQIPFAPAPVKLGLAGGPLLVAIVLSRIGRIGPLIWYMPSSANFVLREVGISLFLACVGLRSGSGFVATLTEGDGLRWILLAAAITAIPVLIVGVVARLVFKLNYLSVCGLLAGSMTDPPALAFASSASGSEGPSVAYATVYPLTMFLRVLSAQFLVLYLL
ncbi:MAG TPA: putative transporter [Myxococcales bacterium]|jgi:putative transport protein|nr:putative transporter [Myxococcales bacterium]